MNPFRIFFGLFVVFLSFGIASAQSPIGVKLDIDAKASVKSDIESFVKRELRALRDIDFYATKPGIRISLLAVAPRDVVAISVLVEEKLDSTWLLESLLKDAKVGAPTRTSLVNSFGVEWKVTKHEVLSDDISKLADLCSRVVRSLDTDIFEKAREVDAVARKFLEETPKIPLGPKTTSKPLSSGASPFESEYVGGEITLISIFNNTDRQLTLVFGGIKYSIAAGAKNEIEVAGGRYEYSASVPRAYPASGVKEFGKGYKFSWRFYIVRR